MATVHYKIQRALDQIRHTLPETVKSRLLCSSDDINPILVSIGDESESVMCVVPVCVGNVVGYYCVNVHKVFVWVAPTKEPVRPFYSLDSWDIMTPTRFECLGGKEGNRKWRISVRVVTEEGCEGKTLGQWLKDHDLEGLMPAHCASSPKKTFKKDLHSPNKRGNSKKNGLEVRKSPTKRKNSPMKKNSGMKSPAKAGEGGLGSHSQSRVYDINADSSFWIANFKDFLPVVTSGTPIVSSDWQVPNQEEPCTLSWLHEDKEDKTPNFDNSIPSEDDLWQSDPAMERFGREFEKEDLVPFEQSLSKLLDL